MQSAAVKDDSSSTPLYEPSPDFKNGFVGWTYIEGRGQSVVALKDIPNGTVIENAPVIIMDAADLHTPGRPRNPLLDYAFWWGDVTDADIPDHYAVIKAGYLALTNHNPNGNSDVEQDRPNKRLKWFAIRDIKAGEEVTFDYACDLWFKPQS